MSRSLTLIALAHLLLISTFSIVLLGEETVISLAREDGVIESLGALFFFVASVAFAVAFARSSGHGNHLWRFQTRRNVIYLFLALLFFFGAGEEISWGQRIFGWHTPEGIAEINAQGETNLHNLWLFQHWNPDGTQKAGLSKLLTANRVFSLFWLGFCVMIPLLAIASGWCRGLFTRFGIPVTHLWIGSLFMVNYVTTKVVVQFLPASSNSALGDSEFRFSVNEMKESNYAVLFALVAIFEVLKFVRGRAKPDTAQ